MQITHLDKTEITTMVKEKCDGRAHIVQIYGLKATDSEKKQRISMRVSDGCYFIRAASVPIANLQNYDIVNITNYRATELRGNMIMLVEKLERVYTDLVDVIGSPVEINKVNSKENLICTEIPLNAKLVSSMDISKPVKEDSPVVEQSYAEVKGVKPIKALGLHSNDWTIKVRILRKGEQKKFFKEKTGESYLAPLEFIDNEGTLISATLFATGVDRYLSILKPMGCYIISNGNIKFANKKYTSIKTDYCINLDGMAAIQEVPDDPSIPRSGYSFTPIAQIAALPNTTMIDTIGVVRSVSEVAQFPRKDGTQTVKRTINLYDDSGHEIEVTLWGAIAEGEYKANDILAFKSVKVSNYNGKQLNSTFDTIIEKEPEDSRAKNLRKWKNTGEALELVSLTNKSSFSGNVSMLAEVIKTGENLGTDPKGLICWITGNIIIVNYEKGFYYMGCKKCKKKVLDTQCDKCKEDAIPYYMFNMKISDGTESIWVHVFGEQGELILGRPAEEILKSKDKDNTKFRQIFEIPKGNVKLNINIIDICNAYKSKERII